MRRKSWPFVVIALVALLLAVIGSRVMGAGSFAQWIHGVHGRR